MEARAISRQRRLSERHLPWLLLTVFGSFVTALIAVTIDQGLLAEYEIFPPILRGYTVSGGLLGVSAAACCIFTFAYSLRKRSLQEAWVLGKGTLAAWLWAHVYFGVLSMLVLAFWVALNWRIPGMLLIAAGLLMNFAAVTANDGKMPVSADALRVAGRYEEILAGNPAESKHVVADGGTVRLWVLTDIIGIPKQVPFAAVWSIGDIALSLGIALLCFRTIRGEPGSAEAGAGSRSAREAQPRHETFPAPFLFLAHSANFAASIEGRDKCACC